MEKVEAQIFDKYVNSITSKASDQVCDVRQYDD